MIQLMVGALVVDIDNMPCVVISKTKAANYLAERERKEHNESSIPSHYYSKKNESIFTAFSSKESTQ